ncbi:hypothetical protein M9458_026839, partial [Cirrhinus mrigala]
FMFRTIMPSPTPTRTPDTVKITRRFLLRKTMNRSLKLFFSDLIETAGNGLLCPA